MLDAEDRAALLDRAEALLPKYGGFATGALNQASLLLGLLVTVQEWGPLVAELELRDEVNESRIRDRSRT